MGTADYHIHLHLPDDAEADAATQADLQSIRAQIEYLKELMMSIVTELQTKFAAANAVMAAGVLTIQQLRQALDAAREALAVEQASPPVPAGSVVLTAEEQAILTNMGVSLPDSTNALASAIEANAENQVPTTPAP